MSERTPDDQVVALAIEVQTLRRNSAEVCRILDEVLAEHGLERRGALRDTLRQLAQSGRRQSAATTRYQDVRAFHEALGLHVGDEVRPCGDMALGASVRRGRLIAEEFGELLAALGVPVVVISEIALHMIREAQRAGAPQVPAWAVPGRVADALADLAYVVESTAVEAGIDTEPMWREVHAANMRKAGGAIDEHGKLQKPVGWTPPDIDAILAQQIERAKGGES